MMDEAEIKKLCIEAHAEIVAQRHELLKRDLALSLALIALDCGEPGSSYRRAAETIRRAINSKFFPPQPRNIFPTLVVDNNKA